MPTMLGLMIKNRNHRLAAAVLFAALFAGGLGVLLLR
jgi:hypothetical protein